MSHFYGNITNSARKTNATARAHKNTGLTVEAQSYEGKIIVELEYNDKLKKDVFCVYRESHLNSDNQLKQLLCRGAVDMSLYIPTKFLVTNIKKEAV